MKIVITGASGQLGRELARQLESAAIPLDHSQLDVTNAAAVERVIDELRPDAVVNTAAYTAVDKAEQERDAARLLNATAVEHLAAACRRADAALVQISTDYVFGGDLQRRTPYLEDDPTAPQGVYARTKLEGERAAAGCPRHFILRTCGLFGVSPRRNNFIEAMLRLGAERGYLRVVGDQQCCPTSCMNLARAIRFLLTTDRYGLYHVVSGGSTTWYDFAVEIFSQAGLNVELERISTEQFGAAADRPRYSVLDTAKYHRLSGPAMPTWQEALWAYLSARS